MCTMCLSGAFRGQKRHWVPWNWRWVVVGHYVRAKE